MRPKSKKQADYFRSIAITVPAVSKRTSVLDVFVYASPIDIGGEYPTAIFAVRTYVREHEDANRKRLIDERVAKIKLNETFANAKFDEWTKAFTKEPSLFAEIGTLLQNIISHNNYTAKSDYIHSYLSSRDSSCFGVPICEFDYAHTYLRTNIPKNDLEKTIAYGTTQGAQWFQSSKDDPMPRYSEYKKERICAEGLSKSDLKEIKSLEALTLTPESQLIFNESLDSNLNRFLKPIVITKEKLDFPFNSVLIPEQEHSAILQNSTHLVCEKDPTIELFLYFGDKNIDNSTVDFAVRMYAACDNQRVLMTERVARLVTPKPLIDYKDCSWIWREDPLIASMLFQLMLKTRIFPLELGWEDNYQDNRAFKYPNFTVFSNLPSCDLLLWEQWWPQNANDNRKHSFFNAWDIHPKLDAEMMSLRKLLQLKENKALLRQSEEDNLRRFLYPVVLLTEKPPEPASELKTDTANSVDLQETDNADTAQKDNERNIVEELVSTNQPNDEDGVAVSFWESNYY